MGCKKIEKGYAAISNEVSICTDYTHGSEELIDHAIQKGWWSEKKEIALILGQPTLIEITPDRFPIFVYREYVRC